MIRNDIIDLCSRQILKDIYLDERRGVRLFMRSMFEGWDCCLEVWEEIELC